MQLVLVVVVSLAFSFIFHNYTNSCSERYASNAIIGGLPPAAIYIISYSSSMN